MNPEPLDLPSVLRSRLDPGEAPQWTGAPDGATLASRTKPFVALGALAAVAMVGWVAQTVHAFAVHADNAGILALSLLFVGIPYIVFTALLLHAPYSARARAERTLYAITERRLILMQGIGEGGFDSVEPKSIGSVTIRRGDIYIHSAPDAPARIWKLSGLPDAGEVADRLRALAGLDATFNTKV
ncbi:MAG TPA: hypothetical protein VGK19_03325 [Capsulimonadaceae bacterium]